MTAVERANAYMTSSGIDQATFLMAAELIARGDHKIEPGKTVLKNSGMTMVEIATAATAFEAAATAAAVDADGREEEQGASPQTMASPMHESSRTESDIEMAPAEAAAKPDAQPESGPNATGYDCDDCKDAFVNAMLVAFAIVVFALFVCCLSCPVWAIVTWNLHADEMTAEAAKATLLFSISGFVSYFSPCFPSFLEELHDEDDYTAWYLMGAFTGAFPTTSLALAIWGLQNLHGDEPNHIQIMFIAAICGYGFWVLSWTFFVTTMNWEAGEY